MSNSFESDRSKVWRRLTRLLILPAILFVTCGCNRSNRSDSSGKPSEHGYTDSAIVIARTGDDYTIRHGNVEIHAVCQYTSYNFRGEEESHGDHCLKALPVGKQIKVRRGEGDWFFVDWEQGDVRWHMGLAVKKEETKNGR